MATVSVRPTRCSHCAARMRETAGGAWVCDHCDVPHQGPCPVCSQMFAKRRTD